MKSYNKLINEINSVDLSTKRKRKAAVIIARNFIERIFKAQFDYLDRCKPNFMESAAYAAAENTALCLHDAVVMLLDAFE